MRPGVLSQTLASGRCRFLEKMHPTAIGSCNGLRGVAPGGLECVAQRAAGKCIQGLGIGHGDFSDHPLQQQARHVQVGRAGTKEFIADRFSITYHPTPSTRGSTQQGVFMPVFKEWSCLPMTLPKTRPMGKFAISFLCLLSPTES